MGLRSFWARAVWPGDWPSFSELPIRSERGEVGGGVKECRGVEAALVDQMEGLKGGLDDHRLLPPPRMDWKTHPGSQTPWLLDKLANQMSGCTIQYKHLYGLKPISIYILKPSNMNVLCSNADCVCGGLCLNDIHAMKIW